MIGSIERGKDSTTFTLISPEYVERLEQENKELKDKIDKAIEYIKELQNSDLVFSNIAYKELLEILGDKE